MAVSNNLQRRSNGVYYLRVFIPSALVKQFGRKEIIMTSHASPFYQSGGKPFINMINDGKFKPQWKKLILEYPDRFVFALDNVFSKFWMPDLYLDKMKMWWSVASDLPNDVAQAFAHGNSERLWKLKVKPDGVMKAPHEAMKALGPVTGYSANAAHR